VHWNEDDHPGRLCEENEDVPNSGKGRYETVSRTKKGSGGLDGALHITPNTLRMLGTGNHGATPIRLEQFDVRNIWKTESDFHARVRIFD
jgi:hypothetical protein